MPPAFDQPIPELDEGLLADVIIQMETVEDSFEKSLARYDYPYADGTDLEDMGQKAHTIRVRCWFWDDAENQSYDEHTLLLDVLATKDLLDFLHPKYGLLKGKIESIIVRHDDHVRAAAIDLTFVEQMRQAIAVSVAQSVQSAAEEAFIATQAAQEDLLAADIAAHLPLSDGDAVAQPLDPAQSLLAHVRGYSQNARLLTAGIEAALSEVESAVSAIVSPADSIQATLAYGATLPGRILGELGRILEKYGLLYSSLQQYPSLYISRLDDALTDLETAYAVFTARATSPAGVAAGSLMSRHLLISGAQRLALEAATLYAADQAAAVGREGSAAVMTIGELETTLSVVRARLDRAVSAARTLDGLKTMAVALLNQVNSVRLEREKMVRVTLDNPMPLHLVCLKYGLPYTDAERLLRINRISRPNYTEGVISVYARPH